ncbi:MAG: dTDP-4-amino-4,6-dideoxygalactose transaminase [Parvicellaceae bacterium]|jgi:dTDP-4-amino-4,6-dideoxygalactose transaminase
MKIPFVDLKAQYSSHKEEIDAAIKCVIDDCAFIGGAGNKYVQEFEQGFSNYLGIKHTVACANGTDAIEIALQAMNIGAGDEVIVPACSWFSTAEAVTTMGAIPVFVDVFENDLNINVNLIEEKITSKTKCIIPVHLYGAPADMPAIMKIARKHNLKVIEDCAQAHGARINDQIVGTFGNVSTFSFYPGKNLGAYGDAGAICTNEEQLESKARIISQHGQKGGKHNHVTTGRNSRLDGIQAAILNVKLPYLDGWIDARRENAALYRESLKSSVGLYIEPSNCKSVYHLMVIKIKNREQIIKTLKEKGVQCAIHYPVALPMLKPYESENAQNEYPIAYKTSQEILSIPLYPELTQEQIKYVCTLLT